MAWFRLLGHGHHPIKRPLKQAPVTVRQRRLQSAWRRCFRWHFGASNTVTPTEELPHVPLLGTRPSPPRLAPAPRPTPPLWTQLTPPCQQALLRLLSELLQRQLPTGPGKEVRDEPR